MTTTLCPFCGADSFDIRATGRAFTGFCGTCGASGPTASSHPEALEFWARRSKHSAGLVVGEEPGPTIPAKVKVEARMTKRRG